MSDKLRSFSLHLDSFIALLAAFVFLSVGSKGAGQTVQVDRAQLERSQTASPFGPGVSPEGTVDDHVVASPNDADLGEQEVLKGAEQYDPWTLSVGSPLFYTSNVALTNSGEQGDLITAPVAAVFYQPRITQALYGLIDVRQQFFYYDRFNAFDFGSMDVEAGLSYIIPQFHNLLLRGEYDFNRLTFSDRVLDEFFENQSIILNAEVPFRFSRAHQLTLGVDANISVGADHQMPRRNDYEVYAAYSVSVTRSLSIDSVGRVVVRDYYQGNRTDVSEILAVSANLRLTKWWMVSAISSFARSDSNHEVFDYSVANVGAAMALTAKF